MPDSDVRPLTADELEAYREQVRLQDIEPFKQPVSPEIFGTKK